MLVPLAVLAGVLEREHRENLESGELCGAGVQGNWIQVELGAGTAVWPKGYCVGFGACGAEWFTHWRLEACDGRGGEWSVLQVHEEEAGFGAGQVKSYDLAPTRSPMRHFRIVPMHRPGTNRCLHLYHFDVFGTIVELQSFA